MKKETRVISLIVFFSLIFTSILLSLSLVSAGELRVTQEHPFLVDGEWIDASGLEVGDLLTTPSGEKVRITSLEDVVSSNFFQVYNLEAFPYSDFIVSSDNLSVVVHNSYACKARMMSYPENPTSLEQDLAQIKLSPTEKATYLERWNTLTNNGQNLGPSLPNGEYLIVHEMDSLGWRGLSDLDLTDPAKLMYIIDQKIMAQKSPFLYHASTADNLESMRVFGLDNRKGTIFHVGFGDYKPSSGFGDIGKARAWAADEGLATKKPPLILRWLADQPVFKSITYYSPEPVRPCNLEYSLDLGVTWETF